MYRSQAPMHRSLLQADTKILHNISGGLILARLQALSTDIDLQPVFRMEVEGLIRKGNARLGPLIAILHAKRCWS